MSSEVGGRPNMQMGDGRELAGIFPSPAPQARPRSACGLLLWTTDPATAEAVRDLCGPVAAYVRRSGARLVVCDARALAADVQTIDALARLHLTGKRVGCRITIRDAPDALVELAGCLGLDRVLFQPSVVEAGRKPEEGEQPFGVEEEHDPADVAVGHVEHLQRPGLAPAAWRGLVLPERRRPVRGRRDQP